MPNLMRISSTSFPKLDFDSAQALVANQSYELSDGSRDSEDRLSTSGPSAVYHVKRSASCTWRGLKIERGVPYERFGDPSLKPLGVAGQPTAVGTLANGQKSAAPYAVL